MRITGARICAQRKTTNLEVLGYFEERRMCDGSDLDDLVERKIKGVATW